MSLNIPRLEHNLGEAIECPDLNFGLGVVSKNHNLLNKFIHRIIDVRYLVFLIYVVNYIEGLIFEKCVGVPADIFQQLADPHPFLCFRLSYEANIR